jgi:hypothetical protein
MTTREFRIDGLFGASLIIDWDTRQNAAPMAPEMQCMAVEPGRGMMINLHPDPEEVLAFADALAREATARVAQANEQATPMIEAAAAAMGAGQASFPVQAEELPKWRDMVEASTDIGLADAIDDVARWDERRNVLAEIEQHFWCIYALWRTSNLDEPSALAEQTTLYRLYDRIRTGKHHGKALIMEGLTHG